MANKELDQLIAQLRSQKIRITDQRLAILKYMITHHNHPTAEDRSEERRVGKECRCRGWAGH